MKIQSISVNGLFNEFSYVLNLNSDLTFIHSPNGYGKSTLLHMVFSILKGDIESVKEVPFSRLDITFDDESTLILEKNATGLLIQMRKNRLESKVSVEEIEGLTDIIYLPPDRLTIRRKDGHLVYAIDACAQEMYDIVRSTKEDSELRPSAAERKEMNNSDLDFWCKDLKAKLDFIKDAGFEPSIPAGAHFPPSRYDLMESKEACEDLAYSISDYVDKYYNLAESIVVFKDIVNNIFLNKYIEVTDGGKLVVSMLNGTSLPLNRLSSGETQILLMFYAILFHSHTDGVVVIDEPEISLHVSWQQVLGDYFRDICRVRKVQLIVTTHSPQVIHDKWELATELVQKNA